MAVFLIVALWEVLAPKRQLTTSKPRRWGRNLTITLLIPVLVRMVFPVLALGIAVKAQEKGWGLFNRPGPSF